MITTEDIEAMKDDDPHEARKEALRARIATLNKRLYELPSGVRPSWVSEEAAMLLYQINTLTLELQGLEDE